MGITLTRFSIVCTNTKILGYVSGWINLKRTKQSLGYLPNIVNENYLGNRTTTELTVTITHRKNFNVILTWLNVD